MLIGITVAVLLAVIAAVTYIFLMMPRVTDRADMDLLTTDYAHRGLWDTANPENSLAAFALAVKHGYGIELDVRLSSDGEIMVFHDATLKRMCGIDKKLGDLSCAELKTCRLLDSGMTVPTLDEVLALVDGKVPLLIEIKGEGKEEALCRKVAERMDTYSGAFAVQSFSPLALSWFKSYRPRFARGQLVSKMKKSNSSKHNFLVRFMLSNLLLNILSRPDFISVGGGHMKNPSFRLCASVFGCRGFVWTVRSEDQYKLCHRLGLFAIFEKIRP
ncbi:MAG: glycerophosphodiester phosphodiesterase [Clostridia bacterium]|nr:glycerophosphodiester phosphodiesterase [Clostridia bacterium]